MENRTTLQRINPKTHYTTNELCKSIDAISDKDMASKFSYYILKEIKDNVVVEIKNIVKEIINFDYGIENLNSNIDACKKMAEEIKTKHLPRLIKLRDSAVENNAEIITLSLDKLSIMYMTVFSDQLKYASIINELKNLSIDNTLTGKLRKHIIKTYLKNNKVKLPIHEQDMITAIKEHYLKN